nr:sodium:calcium antiporter [Candidatus Krumholzibacteria bacterium]
MNEMIQFLLFPAGVGMLVLGAYLLVEGGSKVATVLGVPPVVVGLTVVAFGTSAPEFFVSAIGALKGTTELVLG